MAIVSFASSLGVETIETRETIGTRNVAGLDAAPNLSAFSAMVHMISGASHKLFLSLGIGDGAFPKSAKKRHLRWCNSRWLSLRKNVTNEPTNDDIENRKGE
jgi:hypothetical protein